MTAPGSSPPGLGGPAPGRTAGHRLRRRTLYPALLALLLLVATELAAHVGWRIVEGSLLSFGDVRAMRDQIAAMGDFVPPEREEQPGQQMMLYNAIHPYMGSTYSLEANEVPGFFQYHEVNAYGFVDSTPTIQKRGDDRLIVGITGGSVAWWVSAEGDVSLAEELRKSPLLEDKEIVILRMGMGGFKQPQQLMAINWLLTLGGELDVLVNLDGFNEVALPAEENVPQGVHPFYPRQWHLLFSDLADKETVRRAGRIVHLRESRREWASWLDGPLPSRSATAQLLWRLWDRHLAQGIHGATLALQDHVPDELTFEQRGPGLEPFEGKVLEDEFARHWMRCSLQLDRLCAANDIEYFHFLQPNQYVEGSKPMGEEERALAIRSEGGFGPAVRAGYPRLVEQGRHLLEAGVRFHDLREVFATVDSPLYIDDCCHFNLFGNQIVGRTIGRTVRADLEVQALGDTGFVEFFEPPTRVLIDDPRSSENLGIQALFSDGEIRPADAPWLGTRYVVEDERIATVGPRGNVVPLRLGETRVDVINGSKRISITLVNRWPRVLPFGEGETHPGGSGPLQLDYAGPEPHAGTRELPLVLRGAPAEQVGVILVSNRPLEKTMIDGDVPPEVLVLPFPARAPGADETRMTLEVPEGSLIQGRPLFLRVYFGETGVEGEWVGSTSVALTLE